MAVSIGSSEHVATDHFRHGKRAGRACQNVTSRFQHQRDLAPIFAIPKDELDQYTLTHEQFDALISEWNRQSQTWKRAIRDGCRLHGHERIRNELGGHTCRRCRESIRSADP